MYRKKSKFILSFKEGRTVEMDINTVLVGLGLHAKRIYMNCYEQNSLQPTVIVDLKSKKEEVLNYIKDRGLKSTAYFIDDKNRDNEKLNLKDENELGKLLKALNVTHAIISTEPKAHFAYIKFFLKYNIHILVDKPLTAPCDVITDGHQAEKIEEDFYDIKKMFDKAQKKKKTILQVQCQRRWHRGYQFVHNMATEMVKKYNIPITAIQILHCDGMWNMPDEFLLRENHPYKYGYGKLFHSGYHFVDLVSWFEKINDILEDKRPDNVDMYAAAVRPNDFMHMINKEDYHRLLDTKKFDKTFDNLDKYHFDQFGELDIYSLLQFKKGDLVTSTASINLMQNGFSRRSWGDLPEDTYKGNGRVRHEYMNLEIGPLMDIQIHSYQSKEIKDRCIGKDGIGEVEHFNIYVFRNTDIIGGKPMEKYSLADLYENKSEWLGYNESARRDCFEEFLKEKTDESSIYEHSLGIRILSKEYEALSRQHQGGIPFLNFKIPGMEYDIGLKSVSQEKGRKEMPILNDQATA